MLCFSSSVRLTSSLRRYTGVRCLPNPCPLLQQHRHSSTAVNKTTASYSYVIVGAGSAGCVLANRLSENASDSVLLLEAGPKDKQLGSTRLSWKIHMPAALTYNLCDDKYNWFYHTLPQTNMDDRVMYWPRGRVWGGSCHGVHSRARRGLQPLAERGGRGLGLRSLSSVLPQGTDA